MAITRVGSAKTAGFSATTFDITLPGTPAENDIVVAVAVSENGMQKSNGLGGIASAGYTDLVYVNAASAFSYEVAWKRLGASPDSVCTFYGLLVAGRGAPAAVVVYRGVDTVTAIDAAIQEATNTTGLPDPPSYTTVTNNAWRIVVGALNDKDETAATAPATFGNIVAQESTDGDAVGCTLMVADREEATAGALNPDAFGGTESDDWWAGHFALRPAAAAAGGGHINMLLLGVG
jgi:hypothetical protein